MERVQALEVLELKVRRDEKVSIKTRWEFGCLLLERKVSTEEKREILRVTGISLSEYRHRLKLAARYETEDDISWAAMRYGNWHQVVKSGLYEKKAFVRTVSPEITLNEAKELLNWCLLYEPDRLEELTTVITVVNFLFQKSDKRLVLVDEAYSIE